MKIKHNKKIFYAPIIIPLLRQTRTKAMQITSDQTNRQYTDNPPLNSTSVHSIASGISGLATALGFKQATDSKPAINSLLHADFNFERGKAVT